MWTMCEFHDSTCNGFGDNWWTDNPIYYSSIDVSAFIKDKVSPRQYALGSNEG